MPSVTNEMPEGTTVYDFISVGFGPAGLALAVAAHELETQTPLVPLYLESQDKFCWHGGMLIPGAEMQISFIKDLVTLRNPRSEFTFLNYLFEQGRLLKFLNLGTFMPAREEYQDYMRWAAKKFEQFGWVRYSSKVSRIEKTSDPAIIKVICSGHNGSQSYYGRNVILATGGQASIPESFPKHQNLHHSSQFLSVLSALPNSYDQDVLKNGICVVGSGQSAAEIFMHLTKVYPKTKIHLSFRASALKPADDSPFVNEIFDPESRIDEWYDMEAGARVDLINENRATNYSCVRIAVLEEMYRHLYIQKLPGHQVVHELHPYTRVEDWETTEDSLTMHCKHAVTGISSSRTYDHVFCATGYKRVFHREILKSFPDIDVNQETGDPVVDRKYRCNRKAGTAGIYLQGLCEGTHGLSDTLLSVLATRGMEVIQDIHIRTVTSREDNQEMESLTNGDHRVMPNGVNGLKRVPTNGATNDISNAKSNGTLNGTSHAVAYEQQV